MNSTTEPGEPEVVFSNGRKWWIAGGILVVLLIIYVLLKPSPKKPASLTVDQPSNSTSTATATEEPAAIVDKSTGDAGDSAIESAKFSTLSEGTDPGTMVVHINTWGGAKSELFLDVKTASGESLKGSGTVRVPDGLNSEIQTPFHYTGDIKNLRFTITDPATRTVLDSWTP